MKKKMVSLVIAAALTGSVFAQEENANAIFIDFESLITGLSVGGFGLGLGYERALTESISALGILGAIGFKKNADGISAYDTEYFGFYGDIHARYYPLKSAVNKLFIDIGAGYSHISVEYGEKATSDVFGIGVRVGWKFSKRPVFFEPAVAYDKSFGEVKMPNGSASIPPLDGVKFGASLGVIF
jgi:hypothetical protein